jgi:hypothetical protein
MKVSALIATILAAAFLMQDKPNDPMEKIKQLRKERIATLEALADIATKLHSNGQANLSDALDARVELAKAQLEGAETQAERIKLLGQLVDATQKIEEFAQARRQSAQGTMADVYKAKAKRLEAEIAFEEATAKAAK